MNIFGNKTVVALFDRDKDVENAVAKLQARGFGAESDDDIRIIDKHRLGQETPITTTAKPIFTKLQEGGTPTGGPTAIFESISGNPKESAAVEQNVRDFLMNKGLNNEEAEFYARRIARGGGSMVVVETGKDRVAEAAQIMEQAEAKTTTG